MITNDAIDQLRLEAVDLSEGMSKRVVCVFCGGGASKETSLSIVRKNGALLYNCFRDKCRERGVVSSKGYFSTAHTPKEYKKAEPNPYRGKTSLLSKEARKYVENKFNLTDEDIKSWRETEESDILIPLKDCYGHRYGYIDRRYAGLVGTERVPKAINRYDNRDKPNLHFPNPISNDVTTIVLVEDVVSAQRLSNHVFCASILGTNMTKREAIHLKELGIRNIVFFLDADANKTAKDQKRQHALLFDICAAIVRPPSDPDPKDMNEEELQYWCDAIDQLVHGGY